MEIGRWSRGCRKEKSRIGKPSRSAKRGVRREKWERFPEKSPENGLKTGKSAKNGDFGAKKEGWGRGEKMGFTADFAML